MFNLIKSFLIALSFLFLGNTFGHEMNPARLLLEEQEDATYTGNWMFPANAVGLPAEVSFTGCSEESRNLPRIEEEEEEEEEQEKEKEEEEKEKKEEKKKMLIYY